MSGKRTSLRSRLRRAPRDPGDMAKPGLVEPQSPCCELNRPDTTAACPVSSPTSHYLRECDDASRGGRVAMSDHKGSNKAPKDRRFNNFPIRRPHRITVARPIK